MHASDVIIKIRQELKRSSDRKNTASARKFFKEKIKLYGATTAVTRKIGKEYFKEIKNKKKKYIFGLCEELWRSGYMEESFIACNWSYYIRGDYEPGDIRVFKKWVNTYVSNWASCDTLCNHTIGALLEMYPGQVSQLKQWARSRNRWMRRAAAVSLIIPARQGKFLKDVIEIAGLLLADRDDLVQKGYGWLLKSASNAHRKEIFDYIMKEKAAMPRTALRYAIEKMPKGLKMKAMAK